MTHVLECDRCKELIRGSGQVHSIHGDTNARSELQLPGNNVPDMCDACYVELVRFFRMETRA